MIDLRESSNGDRQFVSGLSQAWSSIPSLLVIDDEPNIVFAIKEAMSSPHLVVISAGTAQAGVELVRRFLPDVVILDVRLPDQSGLDVCDKIRQIDPRLPIILMTAFAKSETAIEAMCRGAYEFLLKPVDLRRLKGVVGKALELSRACRFPALVDRDDTYDVSADQIVGQSSAMQEVYKKIGRIAPQESTVLILGESGTGKELVARAIHRHSRRKQMPYLAINYAALPETILESELFGHERGAFTGADQQRIGKFEQVSGGTIFLDEIGDMSPGIQAKALRLLQEQQFERIGGNQTVKTDVRIIAATNRDLSKDVAEGRFRQDLFYRLNGFTIHLPPLRDRPEDIPVLTEHFVTVFNRELGRTVRPIAPSIVDILQQHHWPGNVREFQSAIHFAMIHTTGDVLLPEYLPETCLPRRPAPVLMPGAVQTVSGEVTLESRSGEPSFPFVRILAYVNKLLAEGKPRIYRHILNEIDRHTFYEVMKHFDGNQLQAAERLGMCRITLRSKLRSHNLLEVRSQSISPPSWRRGGKGGIIETEPFGLDSLDLRAPSG